MTEHPQKITFAEMRDSGVRGTAPYLPAEYCVPHREYFDRCEDWTSVNCRRCCSWAGHFK